MTNQEFDSIIEKNESTRMLKLNLLFDYYWFEISNRYFNFDRLEKELEILRSLRKADLQCLFKVGLNETYKTATVHLTMSTVADVFF